MAWHRSGVLYTFINIAMMLPSLFVHFYYPNMIIKRWGFQIRKWGLIREETLEGLQGVLYSVYHHGTPGFALHVWMWRGFCWKVHKPSKYFVYRFGRILNPTKILNPMLGICAKVITNSGIVCGPYSQIWKLESLRPWCIGYIPHDSGWIVPLHPQSHIIPLEETWNKNDIAAGGKHTFTAHSVKQNFLLQTFQYT